MENYNSEFNNPSDINRINEPATTDVTSANGSSTSTSVKDRVSEVKGKAFEMKDKISGRASEFGSQIGNKIDSNKGKASQGLRATSQRIDRLAGYLEEHDSKDMSDAMVRGAEDMIRKNPTRSLLVGVLVGVVLGRILR